MAEQSDSLKEEMSEILRADRDREPKPNPVVAAQPAAEPSSAPAEGLRGRLRRLRKR